MGREEGAERRFKAAISYNRNCTWECSHSPLGRQKNQHFSPSARTATTSGLRANSVTLEKLGSRYWEVKSSTSRRALRRVTQRYSKQCSGAQLLRIHSQRCGQTDLLPYKTSHPMMTLINSEWVMRRGCMGVSNLQLAFKSAYALRSDQSIARGTSSLWSQHNWLLMKLLHSRRGSRAGRSETITRLQSKHMRTNS